MRMLWVMMGMYMPFVAPSLTPKRCPCVTSVNCNIVRIALTHTHVTLVPGPWSQLYLSDMHCVIAAPMSLA